MTMGRHVLVALTVLGLAGCASTHTSETPLKSGVDAIDPELTLRGLAIFHAEVTGGEPIGMGLG